MEEDMKSRVLVVGATGYIGKHVAAASLRLGHPTALLLRPSIGRDPSKMQLVISLRRAGAKAFKVSLDDHRGLVDVLKQVDVVIATVAEDYLEEQFKLIAAIKDAGNIKRFLPSEFGMDPDRMHHCIPPGDEIFITKREIRRAVEAANIPYTYISANCTASYFVGPLCQILGDLLPPEDKVYIYGDGNKKAIFVAEEDIATYAVLSIEDPRAINTTVYIRPPKNILSQNEIVAMWEKKTGTTLEKIHLSKEGIFKLVENGTHRYVMAAAHFYHIFHEGELCFDVPPNARTTQELYPDVTYTTVDSYLDAFV